MKSAVIIAVAAVALLVAGSIYLRGNIMSSPAQGSPADEKGAPTETPSMDRAEVEARAHMRLPDSVRQLKVHTIGGGIDDAIYLRFELPTEDLPALVRDAGLTPPLSSTRRFVRNYTGSKLAWWKPDAVDPFQSANLIRDQEKPRYALSLLASAGDGPTQTVYVFVTGL